MHVRWVGQRLWSSSQTGVDLGGKIVGARGGQYFFQFSLARLSKILGGGNRNPDQPPSQAHKKPWQADPCEQKRQLSPPQPFSLLPSIGVFLCVRRPPRAKLPIFHWVRRGSIIKGHKKIHHKLLGKSTQIHGVNSNPGTQPASHNAPQESTNPRPKQPPRHPPVKTTATHSHPPETSQEPPGRHPQRHQDNRKDHPNEVPPPPPRAPLPRLWRGVSTINWRGLINEAEGANRGVWVPMFSLTDRATHFGIPVFWSPSRHPSKPQGPRGSKGAGLRGLCEALFRRHPALERGRRGGLGGLGGLGVGGWRWSSGLGGFSFLFVCCSL